MAKFVITAENEKIKYELTFREKLYDFTLSKDWLGMSADKKMFSYQLAEDGIDLSALKCDIDDMCLLSDEMEILNILAELGEIE